MNNYNEIEKSIETRRKINLDKAIQALNVAEKRNLSNIASAHIIEKRTGCFALLFVAKIGRHREILYLTSVNVDGHEIRTCSDNHFRKRFLKSVMSRDYHTHNILK